MLYTDLVTAASDFITSNAIVSAVLGAGAVASVFFGFAKGFKRFIR